MKKMHPFLIMATTVLLLSCTACKDAKARKEARLQEKKANPTFMFWCFRKEIVSDDYIVSEMSKPATAAYLQNRMKTIPGYVDSTFNLQTHTLTIRYQSSTVRKMNFEEAIALSGFSVNGRPANPKAKVPQGVK